MTDKSLKSKAIGIKGKSYVQVKDRVTFFNDNYPNGSIVTKIVSDDGVRVVMMAKVTPDVTNPTRIFTGISASNPDKQIEKMTPHEVAETSSVGRALALMGIGVIDSIASADEMNKVSYSNAPKTASTSYSNEMCPKCKGRLLSGPQGSKWELKCENNKYINGKQSGCTFIKWTEDPKQVDYAQENSDPANIY